MAPDLWDTLYECKWSLFQGCLRGMAVETRRIGIPDARVTQGIVPDCVWEYPCVQEPCVLGSQCLQQGVDSFRCECEQLLCVKPDYAESYKVSGLPGHRTLYLQRTVA
jgi:hypothetical protein